MGRCELDKEEDRENAWVRGVKSLVLYQMEIGMND
jgi:hypothetical protein